MQRRESALISPFSRSSYRIFDERDSERMLQNVESDLYYPVDDGPMISNVRLRPRVERYVPCPDNASPTVFCTVGSIEVG